MGMTVAEKILAIHAGKDKVTPGDLLQARIDLCMANDITAPLAIKAFESLGLARVFNRDKIALVPDHFVPNKDIKAAEQVRMMREYAHKHKITHFYDCSEMGIAHSLLPEQGLIGAGDLVIGADSHTCTYGALGALATGVGSTDLAAAMATGECWFKVPETIKLAYKGAAKPWVAGKDYILHTIGMIGVDGANYQSLEFGGEAIAQLNMAGRFTMCNMAVEAGAKCGIMPVDDVTQKFFKGRARKKIQPVTSDSDAAYSRVIEIDVSQISLQVACPHSPGNVKPVDQVKDVKIDQAFIGSCTNGWLEDLRVAAEILENKKVHRGVRLIVIPATRIIFRQALREGLIETFINAGAMLCSPTCGPCLGGHMGILARGEVAISTTNRNFVGRMGHPESQVYLSNPAVAAASAVLGRIGSPEEIE